MKAYVRQGECGSDTLVPMLFGFEAVFPIIASNWLQEIKRGFFMDKDMLIVKFSEEENAKNMVALWNNRN